MMRKRPSRGEMVEVHGGRIVRSTGGKDRHSKVCTAKGTRDRRVRLAAHTAIQFYDVQDRLGFDRPSRAVDWLINKAKAAIDELDELPPWNPSPAQTLDVYGGSTSLFPPSIDSDPIKASTDAQFQSYQSEDFVNMGCSGQDRQSQDLKLSLHSHGQSQQLFSESSQIGFDGNSPASWAESQRLIGWNSGGGFMLIPPQASQQQLLFGSHGVGQAATHFFSQRGPLQSSNSPSNGAQMGDGGGNNQSYHQAMPSVSGIGFASSGGFSGFPFAAQVRGDQEDHDGGDPSKASSVSSASRRH